MDQTKTLYIANYLELNNKGMLPVCKKGCDQILGVVYNCNTHGNLKKCINTLYDIVVDGVVTPDTDIFYECNSDHSTQCKYIKINENVDKVLKDAGKEILETSSKRHRCWAYVVAAASSKSSNDRNWKDHLQHGIPDETILQFLESAQRGMEQDEFRKYCLNEDSVYQDTKLYLTDNICNIRKNVQNVYNEFASHHMFVAMICDIDDKAPLKRYGKFKLYKTGNPDYHNIQDNNLYTLEVAHTGGNHFSFVF